ncbi:MAG: polysaccharide biosynthesis/export family protein [Caulobacteraceae bacterium]
MSAARAAAAVLALALLAPGAALAWPWSHRQPQPFVNIPYATWSDEEPQYRLYPGDEMDVAFPTAPELNKTVIVQPDGRVMLPLIGPIMAAERTPSELQDALSRAYASQLVTPIVTVTVRAQPLKVFVGGDVGKPGVYDMPGDLDALRAVVEAGGFGDGADLSRVIVIRRGHDGRPMLRTVNLARPLKTVRHADLVPLRRFDIVYVPKTGLAKISDVMTQLRNALPISFNYAFGSTLY